MKKVSLLAATIVFFAPQLFAALTITPADIQLDSFTGKFRYAYNLTRADMADGNPKFHNDVNNFTNVGTAVIDVNTTGVKPTLGTFSASFLYVFDLSAVQVYGCNAYIDTVELRDKIFLGSKLLPLTEETTITTAWSTNNINYYTFNTAQSPTKYTIENSESDIITTHGNPRKFYYRVTFTNADANGFSAGLNFWNRMTTGQSNYFRVVLTLKFLGSPSGSYGGGSGTETVPYQIATPAQLDAIGNNPGDWNKYFVVVNNLDMKDYAYSRALIAYDTTSNATFQGIPFTGSFNGNNHTIKNLNIRFPNNTPSSYLGLFGYVHSAEIKNVRIADARIIANPLSSGSIGGLIGNIYFSSVSNCDVSSSVVSGYNRVGGLVGEFVYGTITDCSADATIHMVSGMAGGLAGYCGMSDVNDCSAKGTIAKIRDDLTNTSSVGGLLGYVSDSNVAQSYSTVDISLGSFGSYSVGGFIGRLENSSLCDDSYSTGDIIANDSAYENTIGGFIGAAEDSDVTNCYTTGAVLNTTTPAGFLGETSTYLPSVFTACFWDSAVCGTTNGEGSASSPDPAGIAGYPTNIMKLLGTYTTSGWDFINETANGTKDIWAMVENVTYPIFADQCTDRPITDLSGDCKVNMLDFALMSEEWLDCGYFIADECAN
jgi:hypothetical protein